MRREFGRLSTGGGGWWRFLAPALFLLVQPAPPARAENGELSMLLEAEAGARSDGSYRQSSLSTSANAETDAPNYRSSGRGGFNLNLSYALRRVDLALEYSPFYDQGFTRRDEVGAASGITHRLNLAANGALGERASLHVSERLLSSPILTLYGPMLAETVVAPRGGNQLFQDFDSELDTDLSHRTVLFLGASQDLRHFADRALSDSRGAGGRAGLRFQVDPLRSLEVKVAAASYRFTGLSANVAQATAAFSTLFGRGGALRLELGGFTVGSQPAEPSGNGRRLSENGLQADLQLTHQRERLRWDGELRHGVAPGAGIGRPVVLDDAVVSVSTLGRRTVLGASASAARSRDFANFANGAVLEGTPGTPASSDRRLVDFVTGTVNASFRFAERARLHGEVSRIWQRSRLAAFDNVSYNRYFLGIALELYQTGDTPVNPASQGGLHVEPHLP